MNGKKNKIEHFPLVDRLHTDVLEEKYGPISSKVLIHNNQIRKAHLIDKKEISRTFAITFLNRNWSREIKKINNEIRKGKPIGKVFREHEYAIRKNVLEVYKLRIPIWLKRAFRTGDNFAKARLSEFYAKKRGKKPEIYGIVVEIYSPSFRKAVINKVDLAQESALTSILRKYGFSQDEIWRRIGQENDYGDKISLFEKAKKESDKKEFMLKKIIKMELENDPSE